MENGKESILPSLHFSEASGALWKYLPLVALNSQKQEWLPTSIKLAEKLELSVDEPEGGFWM